MQQRFRSIHEVSTSHRAHRTRWIIYSCALLSFFCSCSRPKVEKAPADTYLQISESIDRGQYDSALKSAREAWQQSPDSAWGWRFRMQYALTLLYTDQVKAAAAVLQTPPPNGFISIQPRFRYIRAYLHFRQLDPAAKSLVEASVQDAHEAHDAQTEAEATLLLLRFDGISRADVEQTAARDLQV